VQLSREELLEAYRVMRTIRAFDERLRVEFATGDIPGFVHLYVGEEASAAGICAHLDARDHIASNHRGHGHCIAKGCDPVAMMAEIYGKADGLCGGKGGSMHIADLEQGMMGANGIVGAGAPLACGAALSARTLGTGGVAVAFSGDGGSNQGTFAESMNLASVWQLPVVFAVENNGYGEASAAEWAVGGGDFARRAQAFGMPGTRIDGSDYFAVREAAGEAIDRARAGEGPSLIEIEMRRFYGHFEGDAQTYRSAEELVATREARDPIRGFVERVTAAGLLDRGGLEAIDSEVSALIDRAVAAAKAAPAPAAEATLADVYVSY
jgi:pyruvate dehydrogenase E1 component alpha subunit